MKLSLIEKAFRIALKAHEGQTRKGDGVPYITHPTTVGLRLAKAGFSDEIIAAGIVHDVVEDCNLTIEDIYEELGNEVGDIVKGVTHDDSLSWEDKKKQYVELVRNGNEGVRAVSIMDKIHNAESLLAAHAEIGSSVWDRFNRGKEKKMWFEEIMLEAFKSSWENPLIAEYEDLIKKMRDAD